MSAGTLTLTNNSAAVGGSGTAFTTELAAGDFILVTVGGIPYTLPVKTVNSNTSLTLVSIFTGPTQSGSAWSAIPRVAMNLVTAALVAQSTEALRGLNYDKQNWQSIFSVSGNATIKLPDGSQFTGPAWKSILDYIDTVCPVGMRLDWPSLVLPDNAGLGVKYLRLNGASFNKALYPKLALVYPSGMLPDMRGDTLRGYDDGRGVDQGRALLSEQLDSAPNILGYMGGLSNDGSSAGYVANGGGPFSVAAASKALAANAALGAGNRYTTVNFDLSCGGSVPSYGRDGAKEVRMRNMVWNMIVRAS